MERELDALRPGRKGTLSAEALARLVALLASDDSWEEPGDVGAPPFVRVVGEEARDVLLAWGDAVTPALPQLLSLAEHATRWARARAAEVACALGDLGALGRVAALTGDPDADTRARMVRALGRGLVAARPEHAPMFVALFRGLLDDATNVVFAADEVLREKGNLRAGPRPVALAEALRAFLEETPDAVQRVEVRLSSHPTRFTATRALGHLVGESAAAAAIAAVDPRHLTNAGRLR